MAGFIKSLVNAAVEGEGFEIVQIKNHPATTVRVWIDREPNGVTVQDCIDLTRTLRAALTAEGVDPGDYRIEVLSPGLDRLLVREKDFVRFAGKRVSVRLKEKRETRRNFKGVLVGLEDDGTIKVRGDEEWSFTRAEVAEVRLIPDLSEKPQLPKPKQGKRTRKPRKSRRKRPKEH